MNSSTVLYRRQRKWKDSVEGDSVVSLVILIRVVVELRWTFSDVVCICVG